MQRLIKRLLIGTASILVVGIGGTALDYEASPGYAEPQAKTSLAPMIPDNSLLSDPFRKSDIRWAQAELHFRGLYNGSLDGVVGSETKQALGRFQKLNGLDRTATLDPETLDALFGKPNLGQGSSVPANNKTGRSMTNSSSGADLATPATPK